MSASLADWVAQTADDVCTHVQAQPDGGIVTCASGISPSGPIHLGNLREVMIPHLVANELLRRGALCRHVLSWDDFDRLRRIPAGVPERFAEHIGRPLTAVPDPCGDHENWAEHFKAPFHEAMAQLGVGVVEISQTRMYASGAYTGQVVTAMRRRDRIDAVLSQYRTRPGASSGAPASGFGYSPFRPYCSRCGRDDAEVTSFDDETTEITYVCACGAAEGPLPIARVRGKLAWKVDWPMRWAFERVSFEPAGADHASAGSSFTVGAQLVGEIFGGRVPLHFGYSFVGTTGTAKMSGSAGDALTPRDALRIFEPPVLRWLYTRRRPNQAITLAFGQEVARIYDEWDALSAQVCAGTADPADTAFHARASGTVCGALRATTRPLPFRALASVADITLGADDQMLRIVREMTAPDPVRGLDEVRPRLDCARAWISEYLPPQEHTQVRAEPDLAALAGLPEPSQRAIGLLLAEMGHNWSLDGLTRLLYGIPKVMAGASIDSPATDEVKRDQREWFRLLYRLLVGRDTGPRLPTLVLSIGAHRVTYLLGHGQHGN